MITRLARGWTGLLSEVGYGDWEMRTLPDGRRVFVQHMHGLVRDALKGVKRLLSEKDLFPTPTSVHVRQSDGTWAQHTL